MKQQKSNVGSLVKKTIKKNYKEQKQLILIILYGFNKGWLSSDEIKEVNKNTVFIPKSCTSTICFFFL